MAADEGYVFEITATISGGQSVTWATSNSAIAEITRVESTSVEKARITAVKAGQATITATAANGDTATCTVYVLIDEGVYYLKNSDLCLAVDGSLLENTAMKMLAQCTAGPAKIRQLWKIKYIADGYYSIRTFYKQNMALHASGATVDITTIGDYNTLSTVPLASRWKIDNMGDGEYRFKYTGSLGLCLRPNDTTVGVGAKVAGYVSGSDIFHWQLQRDTSVVNQLLLINTAYGLPAHNAVRYVAPGETVTLAEMNLTASFVSLYATNQTVTWHAADPTVVNVDQFSGEITGAIPGASTTITARRVYNSVAYEKTFTVQVTEVPEGTAYAVLQAFIYYDSTCAFLEGELRDAYRESNEDFLSQFNINFNLVGVASTNELKCDESCSAATLIDNCSNTCAPNEDCLTSHHRCAARLLKLLRPETYYVYRFVGYGMCGIDKGEHIRVGGLGYTGGKHAVATSASTGDHYECVRVFQHELTHNLGASHNNCDNNGQRCILKGDVGVWCTDCEAAIMTFLNKEE